MKTAIIALLVLGIFKWSINEIEYPWIRTLFNIAALICFLIYSH